jgi:cytidine deaminase
MDKQELDSLIKAAELATANASPIKSKIKVGCIYQINQGGIKRRIASGNVEFYGAPAIHAEVAGLCKLLSLGYRIHDVELMCLYFEPKLQPPCGACLQALSSYFPDNFKIISCSKGEHRIDELKDLLPFMYRRT